jgi:hemin uptake protein HemP
MDISQDDERGAEPRTITAGATRRVLLDAIMAGEREIIICHQNDEYRLRLTSNNKLLLTK